MEIAEQKKLSSIPGVDMPYSTSLHRTNSSRFTAIIVFSFISAFAFKTFAAENCLLVEPPETPVQFMSNLKCAIVSNTLYQDDTFTDDEKLWKLFAGKEFFKSYPFTIQKFSIHNKVFSIHNKGMNLQIFPTSIDSANLTTTQWSDRLNIGITKSYFNKNSKGIDSAIEIGLGNPRGLQMTFPQVEKIFGKNWKNYSEPNRPIFPSGASTNAASGMATKPGHNGYKYIEYDLNVQDKVAVTPAKILIEFGADGIMDSFKASVGEK